MNVGQPPTLPELATDASALTLGEVAHVESAYACTVRLAGGEVVSCDVLQSSQLLPLCLAVGETVVVWSTTEREKRGVVMGRVGAARTTGPEGAAIPDELLLEAGQSLILRCGDGSVTIRRDGKILIKGKDVVSHAKRVNRVKGGSVSIN